MDNEKQVEVLQQMYNLNLQLLNMPEEELIIFRENNRRLIQNLMDSLSYLR